MIRRWLCPIDGIVDLLEGTDRCPTCGATALDPLDPSNADALAEAQQLHTNRNCSGGMMAVLLLGTVAGTALATWRFGAQALHISMYVVLLGLGGLLSLYAARRDRAWRGIPDREREPGRAWRVATSATVVSLVVSTAFVPIALHTGIDRLAYARGDPRGSWWRRHSRAAGRSTSPATCSRSSRSGSPSISASVGPAALILAAAAVAGALAQAQYSSEPMVGVSAAI